MLNKKSTFNIDSMGFLKGTVQTIQFKVKSYEKISGYYFNIAFVPIAFVQ
jgi:hypothetical protein